MIPRRLTLAGTLAAIATPALTTPARATPDETAAAIAAVTGGRPLQPGHVRLDLAQMVENGNAVGVTVTADPPPGKAVRSLHLFAEANPNPEVFHATVGPAGLPRLSTRIRLATSQTVTALAIMDDGACHADQVTVMVTLAACLE